VPVDLDLSHDLRYAPFSVDDHRRALDSHVVDPEQRFLLPEPERVGKTMILVDEKIIWEPILLPEPAV